jgi:hypothetical protein
MGFVGVVSPPDNRCRSDNEQGALMLFFMRAS